MPGAHGGGAASVIFGRSDEIAGPLNNLGHQMQNPELLLVPLVALVAALAFMLWRKP
jgi:hypothetical protein